jgi:hypothetical protein
MGFVTYHAESTITSLSGEFPLSGTLRLQAHRLSSKKAVKRAWALLLRRVWYGFMVLNFRDQ